VRAASNEKLQDKCGSRLCFVTMVEAIDSGWFCFSYIVFLCVRVFSSLTLPISLPYTSRYDPAQEAKVQVVLSLLVPMRVVIAQQSSLGVCGFFSAAYIFWTFVLCCSPVKKPSTYLMQQ
jgi:hypothetical protein